MRPKLHSNCSQPPAAFRAAFGSERQCRRFLFGKKWPNGFECPRCHHRTALERQGGRKWVCARKGCPHWESPTVGTIAESIKKPLRLWFWGLWLYTHARGGMTASRLQEELGLGSYQTAWTWCHKFRAAIQNHPQWASAFQALDATLLVEEEASRPSEIHGWRGEQKESLAKLCTSLRRSPQISEFHTWLISLNAGRSSAKHGRAYWAERQLWVRCPSPGRRWAAFNNLLSSPPVPYWRLVGRAAPQIALKTKVADMAPPPDQKSRGAS